MDNQISDDELKNLNLQEIEELAEDNTEELNKDEFNENDEEDFDSEYTDSEYEIDADNDLDEIEDIDFESPEQSINENTMTEEQKNI